MRAFSVLLGVFLFSLLLPCAQAQELQPPSWELGWITDVDPKYIVELEDDWDVEGELVVFVNNERSNELNLALNYDFDEDGPFAFDGPESITVAANTNDSFTILISGVSDKEVRAFSPSSSLPLTLTAEESIGETSVGNQEIEADITVPRKYMLMAPTTLGDVEKSISEQLPTQVPLATAYVSQYLMAAICRKKLARPTLLNEFDSGQKHRLGFYN